MHSSIRERDSRTSGFRRADIYTKNRRDLKSGTFRRNKTPTALRCHGRPVALPIHRNTAARKAAKSFFSAQATSQEILASTCLKLCPTCAIIRTEHSVLAGKLARILILAVIALGVVAAWQFGSCEVANDELRSEMRDIASQDGVRIGFTVSQSDEEIRSHIIRLARTHDIYLESAQVTVQSTGTGVQRALFIAADYDQVVKLPGLSFTLHFNPQARGRPIAQTRDR